MSLRRFRHTCVIQMCDRVQLTEVTTRCSSLCQFGQMGAQKGARKPVEDGVHMLSNGGDLSQGSN